MGDVVSIYTIARIALAIEQSFSGNFSQRKQMLWRTLADEKLVKQRLESEESGGGGEQVAIHHDTEPLAHPSRPQSRVKSRIACTLLSLGK